MTGVHIPTLIGVAVGSFVIGVVVSRVVLYLLGDVLSVIPRRPGKLPAPRPTRYAEGDIEEP